MRPMEINDPLEGQEEQANLQKVTERYVLGLEGTERERWSQELQRELTNCMRGLVPASDEDVQTAKAMGTLLPMISVLGIKPNHAERTTKPKARFVARGDL